MELKLNSSDGAQIKSRDFASLAGDTDPSRANQVTSNPTKDPVKRLRPAGDILALFPGENVPPAQPESHDDSVTALADDEKGFIGASENHGTMVPEQHLVSVPAARTKPRTEDKTVFPAVGRKKVTKAKQKQRPKARHPKDRIMLQPGLDSTPSEEDLLNLLAYRYQKDRDDKTNDKAVLQAKNLELEELRRNQVNLERYLAESERKAASQEKELGRYKEAISKKVGKLTKFVNGLASDHNQLRNDAKLIAQKQDAGHVDGIELAADIQNVRVLAQEWTKKLAENPRISLRDARQKIDQLEEVVGLLNRELEDRSGLLATERDRTVELEAKIKLAAVNHDEVKALMDSHHEVIIEKLNILPNVVELARGDGLPDLGAELRIKVEECLGLLEVIHDRSRVLPEKFQDILGPVRVACGESVTLRVSDQYMLT